MMLVDKAGRVVWKGASSVNKERRTIERLLNEMAQGAGAVQTVEMESVSYMPATLEQSGELEKSRRRDRFTSLACGRDGKVYVVFTSNRNGNSDVFIRAYDGNSWSEDTGVADSNADEFDGTVLVDKQDRVWVCWTSNAESARYNIFCRSFTDLSDSNLPVQVTRSRDDAMHGRMACDDKGGVWVSYYQWHRMRGRSRDKEVYVRRWDGQRWSAEIQVSPTDVPDYEDHCDPAIAGYEDGVIVAWSWDFHQPEGYTKQAEQPTVFLRRVSSDLNLSRAAAVSGRGIDMTPAVAVGADKRIWVAWDSLGGREKAVCLKEASLGADGGTEEIRKPGGRVVNVCSPCFAAGANDVVTLVWSQTSDGKRWVLRRADFEAARNRWSDAKAVESEGNPRFCSAGHDSKGELWISYTVETDKGREIRVSKLASRKSE